MNTRVQHNAKGGKEHEEHGNNLVTVTIDQASKDIHRGNYRLDDLKAALGVSPERDLDIIEDGKLRAMQPGEKTTVREGMEFVSRQQAGGAS